MTIDAEALYRLLPEIYRTRDAAVAESLPNLLTPDEQLKLKNLRDQLAASTGLDPTQQRDLARLEERRLNGPLKALLTVIAEQAAGMEYDIEQLYDDQFIETCAGWVVPYIADLIGYRPINPDLQALLGSTRAEVANTIRFRRRKGTAAVLEDLALSVTEWDAAAVEFFLRLATTSYMNHVRPEHMGTAGVRNAELMEKVGTPFDGVSHTADVRRIGSGRGRYNIPNVGIFLWRVASRKLTDSPAFRVDGRRYLFSPLGVSSPIFYEAQRDPEVSRPANALKVPMPISLRALHRHLEVLFGPGLSLSIKVGNQDLTAADVEACDLSDLQAAPGDWAHPGQLKVAIDPVLGRICLPAATADPVTVTYHYGSLADMGGGEYGRASGIDPAADAVRRVPADRPLITQALADLAGRGWVAVSGSGRYDETVTLNVGSNRILGIEAVSGSRPLLQLGSDLTVEGGDGGEVILSGLVIAGGRILVPAIVGGRPNQLQRLTLRHCTLVPGGGLTPEGLPGPVPTTIEIEAAGVTLEIDRSIVGSLRLVNGSSAIVTDSIVDGLAPELIACSAPDGLGPAGSLDISSSTVIGKVHCEILKASNCIFDARLGEGDPWAAPVITRRRQVGYVRYSYVPPSSRIPRRYVCQPAGADRVPQFASRRYGNPAYLQLHAACPCALRTGAADGGEMGAYHHTYGPQRQAGLSIRLDEYLPFGLEAGLIYAS